MAAWLLNYLFAFLTGLGVLLAALLLYGVFQELTDGEWLRFKFGRWGRWLKKPESRIVVGFVFAGAAAGAGFGYWRIGLSLALPFTAIASAYAAYWLGVWVAARLRILLR
jgi:hypothetical protein